MKKSIALALCFILTACILIGCGRKKNHQTTDTTTTPTTLTTHTTGNTTPSNDGTVPSSSSVTQNDVDTTTLPSTGNDNTDDNSNIGRSRSNVHHPRINGRLR